MTYTILLKVMVLGNPVWVRANNNSNIYILLFLWQITSSSPNLGASVQCKSDCVRREIGRTYFQMIGVWFIFALSIRGMKWSLLEQIFEWELDIYLASERRGSFIRFALCEKINTIWYILQQCILNPLWNMLQSFCRKSWK